MEFLRNKQKLMKIAKSKGLNLDEFLFRYVYNRLIYTFAHLNRRF